MRRAGHIWPPEGPYPFVVNKSFSMDKAGLNALYRLQAPPQPHAGLRFGVELNFSFLSEADPGKHILLPDGRRLGLDQPHEAEATNLVSLLNQTDGFRLDLELSPPAVL